MISSRIRISIFIVLALFVSLFEIEAQSISNKEGSTFFVHADLGVFAATIDEAIGISGGLGLSIQREKISIHFNYQASPEFTIFSEPYFFNEVGILVGQTKSINRFSFNYSGGAGWLLAREGGDPGDIDLPWFNDGGLVAQIGLETKIGKRWNVGLGIRGAAYTKVQLISPVLTMSTDI